MTICECCAEHALYDTHFRSSADVVPVGMWAGGGGQLTGDGVGDGGLPVLLQPSSEEHRHYNTINLLYVLTAVFKIVA